MDVLLSKLKLNLEKTIGCNLESALVFHFTALFGSRQPKPSHRRAQICGTSISKMTFCGTLKKAHSCQAPQVVTKHEIAKVFLAI